jgi:S1-C subfamily serine protease
MEDSSQNPYIPQESEAIRQKVYEHQSPLGRVVKIALIVTIALAVLIGISLFFVVPRTSTVDKEARQNLADILQPPDQTLKRISVSSDLGFRLNYDNRIYSSYAEVGDSSAGSDSSAAVLSGETYENNDLRTTRAYNYIRIRPLESVDSARALAPLPPQFELFATVTDDELTAAAAVPENKGLSKLSLFVKLDGDRRASKKVADDNTVVSIETSKPVGATIRGVEYQKVRYTTTNENHRVANVKYDECYYTIQNDQPYSLCVTGVRPTNVSAASLVEQVFDSIAYEQPSINSLESETDDNSAAVLVKPSIRLAQATDSDESSNDSSDESSAPAIIDDSGESPLLTITPSYYGDQGSLGAIASNQPNVVRIGTLYCTDLSLRYETGETATTLTDACVGNVASGVFVSQDGYIATTGHAIRTQKKAAVNGYINFAPDQDQMLDRLQRVLDYLLKAKIILQTDAEYLKTGAAIGDQEALAKVQNIASVIPDNYITPVKEEYTYAIQPTDKPIVVNRNDSNKPSFAYSDSVISAKFIVADYDSSKSLQEVFGSETPQKDVGLLKVDGEFPNVSINSDVELKANDMLNIVGYPAYTDSSLTIDKIRNQPIATVSKVEQAYEKDGGRLIQTNMPVLPGNDGAPVFDNTGKLVGFAVYGMSYCPDQLCFANGTVRSIAELMKLLEDNNITLKTDSAAAAHWRDGVTEFFRANYAASTSLFTAAGNEYIFNRWSEPVAKLSASKQGTQADTSMMNQLQTVLIIVLVISVVASIILGIAYAAHRRRISDLRVGHYGSSAPTQPTPVQNQTQALSQAQVAPQAQPTPQQYVQNQPPNQLPPVQQSPQRQQSQPQPLPGQQYSGVNAQPPYPPQQAPQSQASPEDSFYK